MQADAAFKNNAQKAEEIIQFFKLTQSLHSGKEPNIMEYAAYIVAIIALLLDPYDLRKNRMKKEEVEEEVFTRYFDVLAIVNRRIP